MTLVSVVIPTKDRAEALVDAVRSVFAGSYQQFELFVVDQSTEDTTREALEPFTADARFHYVQNLHGRPGPASSRNIGIALSSGEIVAHIDDDVTVRPDWMERLVAEFEADPTLDFLAGKLAAPPYDTNAGFIPASDPEAEQPPLNQWTVSIFTAGANFAMRRSLFKRIGGYDECFGPGTRLSADDGIMALRIARSGAVWKARSSVEVVHTHGFRPGSDAPRLLESYEIGNGGMFGRETRSGDLRAGLWFLGYQMHALLTRVLPNALHGRRPLGLGSVRNYFEGFWLAFKLPPTEGFISGADLLRLRRQYTPGVAAGLPPVLAGHHDHQHDHLHAHPHDHQE